MAAAAVAAGAAQRLAVVAGSKGDGFKNETTKFAKIGICASKSTKKI